MVLNRNTLRVVWARALHRPSLSSQTEWARQEREKQPSPWQRMPGRPTACWIYSRQARVGSTRSAGLNLFTPWLPTLLTLCLWTRQRAASRQCARAVS